MIDAKGYADMKRDASKPMAEMAENAPEYPWGLCLNLTEVEMKKLGIDMPKIGETIHIMAMTRVESCHARASADSEPSHGCTLQITSMKAETEDDEDEEDDERTPAEKVYGKRK